MTFLSLDVCFLGVGFRKCYEGEQWASSGIYRDVDAPIRRIEMELYLDT